MDQRSKTLSCLSIASSPSLLGTGEDGSTQKPHLPFPCSKSTMWWATDNVSDPDIKWLLQDLQLLLLLSHIIQEGCVLPNLKLHETKLLGHCLEDHWPGESCRPMVGFAWTRNKPLFYCHWNSGVICNCSKTQHILTTYGTFHRSALGWPESGGQRGGNQCVCAAHAPPLT